MAFGTAQRTRRLVPEFDDLELGWLAGLIEGEGCFYVSKKRILLSVTSTDKDVIDMLRATTSVGSVYGPKNNGTGGKDYWRWQIQSKWDIADIAAQIYPYMGKRRRAKIRECLKAVGLADVL